MDLSEWCCASLRDASRHHRYRHPTEVPGGIVGMAWEVGATPHLGGLTTASTTALRRQP
jgi:hypothetical protein